MLLSLFRKLLVIIFLTGIVYSQNFNQSKYQTARSAVLKKDYDTAERLYKELISSDPDNWMYTAGLNRLYIRLKKYDDSLNLLSKRAQRKPKDIINLCELGGSYYLKKNLQTAFKTWDKAFKIAGSNDALISMVANYPVRYRLYDVAIKYYLAGKEKVTNKIPILHQLINLYVATSDFENSIVYSCELINAESKQLTFAKNILRRIFLRNRSVPKVEEILINEFDKNKKNEFTVLLKDYYLLAKKYDLAKEKVLELFKVNKKTNDLKQFSEELLIAGKNELALEILDILISNTTNPEMKFSSELRKVNILKENLIIEKNYDEEKILNLKNLYNSLLKNQLNEKYKSEIFYHLADLDFKSSGEAKYLEQFISRFSEGKFTISAKYDLAKTYLKIEKTEQAELLFEDIYNSKQASLDLRSEAGFRLLKTAFWTSDFKKVNNLLPAFLAEQKNSYSNETTELSLIMIFAEKDSVSVSQFAKADYFENIEKTEEAELLYKKVSKIESLMIVNYYAAIRLAEIKFSQSEYSEALAILNEITEKEKISPFYDKALYLQGRIFQFGIGDFKKAVEIYSEVLKKYPDSIYLDECRKNIKTINNVSE